MADSEGLIIEEKKPPNSLVTSTNAVNCRSNFDFWPNLKPFVNGFLAGQLTFLQSYSLYCFSREILLPLLAEAHDQHRVAKIKNLLHQCRKRIPVHFLCEATHTTALFGSFDTLTKKVEAANDGFPLTLYQEACCGLISGGIAACIWHPFRAASASLIVSESVEKQFNYRNLFASLYQRSKERRAFCIVERESVGVSKSQAQLGAGIVSAFFAAACSYPYTHIAAIKDIMLTDGGRKYSYRAALYCLCEVFRPGGNFKIYSGIFRSFLQFTPYIVLSFSVMLLWMFLPIPWVN